MSTPTMVDGPALIQALRVEVATWQARSLGQRALIDAANAKQMGLIAADATKLQGIYDDVIARLYAVLDRVDASRPAATVPSAVDTALEPRLKTLYAEATHTGRSWRDRYGAVCALIMGMTKQTASTLVEQAEAVYDEARRNLGGLQQVAAKLREMSFDDKEAVRVTASAVLSIEVADKLRQTFGSVDYYVEALYNAVASLQSLIVTGGQQRRCADAIAELQRLRDDLAVGLQLRHLKR